MCVYSIYHIKNTKLREEKKNQQENIKTKVKKTGKHKHKCFIIQFHFVPTFTSSLSLSLQIPPLPSFFSSSNIFPSKFKSLISNFHPTKWRIPKESSTSISRAVSTHNLPPPPQSPPPPPFPLRSSNPIPTYHLPMEPQPRLHLLLNMFPVMLPVDEASGKRFVVTG